MANCVSEGGYLVEIDNQEEQDVLTKFLQMSKLKTWVLLGGTDVGKEGQWIGSHSGREIMDFNGWHKNEPSGHFNENCLATYSGYGFMWVDIAVILAALNNPLSIFTRMRPYFWTLIFAPSKCTAPMSRDEFIEYFTLRFNVLPRFTGQKCAYIIDMMIAALNNSLSIIGTLAIAIMASIFIITKSHLTPNWALTSSMFLWHCLSNSVVGILGSTSPPRKSNITCMAI